MNKVIARLKNQTKNSTSLDIGRDFNISESYTSLMLGIAVVIFVAFFFVSFIRNRTPETLSAVSTVKSEIISQEMQKAKQNNQAAYTVVQGDTLWSIAENHYGSGYDWGEIAKVNNITDPSTLEAGAVLVFPKDDAKILATSTVADSVVAQTADQQQTEGAITDKTYTVKPGDDLWDIAVRAYGDGYRWPDIAKANNLADPDLIFSGNVLTIPR